MSGKDRGASQGVGALPAAQDRATHEQSPQAVSAVPVGIPSAAFFFLTDEAATLDEISLSYRIAAQTGKMNDRRIKPDLAKAYARQFAERASAIYMIAPLLRDFLAQAIETRQGGDRNGLRAKRLGRGAAQRQAPNLRTIPLK